MKRKIISAGLIVAGVAGMRISAMADSAVAMPKFWNVGANLRGFYDDNYNISGTSKGSAGAELSPSVSLNVPLQQTDFGIRYTYGLYYYEDRDHTGLDPFDMSHQADVWVDHAFNERWKGNFKDTFVSGQEPALLRPGSTAADSSYYRMNGDNIANHGTLGLDTAWTRLFSTTLTYGNNFYDYAQKGWNSTNGVASRAGTLNRVEQSVALDLKWDVQQDTTVFVGYQLAWSDFNAGEQIGQYTNAVPQTIVYHSKDLNSLSHYGYVGATHQFTSNFGVTARGGATYTDDYNTSKTTWSPYADVSANYTYAEGSHIQLGVTHDVSATDAISVNEVNGSLTQNAESTVVYLDITRRFLPSLVGEVIGRYQNSVFNGGANDNEADNDLSLGVNLHYQINRYLGAEAGYNYDHVLSQIAGRGFERNRVYVGLGFNY